MGTSPIYGGSCPGIGRGLGRATSAISIKSGCPSGAAFHTLVMAYSTSRICTALITLSRARMSEMITT